MPTAVLDGTTMETPEGTVRHSLAQSDLRIAVHSSIAAAGAFWTRCASEGIATPYQSLDWIEAYSRLVDTPAGHSPAIVTMSDAAGAPLMLVPLSVQAAGPLRIARFIGGKHANFNMPVCAHGAAALDATALRAGLQEAGRQAGIDLFAFANQPYDWEGVANPFALLGGSPSPSAAYKLALSKDATALLNAQLSKDTRKKLRRDEGKLAAFGPLTYRRAETRSDITETLNAFLAFKAERLQAMGIADPFDAPEIRAFLADVAHRRGPAGPVLELHALRIGERIIAIFGAMVDRQRMCCLFTAFDADPEFSRWSPGTALLTRIIANACDRGLKTFDLGVGEARYKTQFCNATEALFDSLVPVSVSGRLAGAWLARFGATKRWAKQSPGVMKLIGKLRSLKSRAKS